MIENTTLIKVLNRDNGSVGYTIPDLGNLHRTFQPGEEKELPMDELRKLSYLPGGKALLEECLVVRNEEALKELFIDAEPEYFYSEDDIKKILLNGTLEEFLDCLDFAPTGVIELIKEYAVKLEINDIAKRKAILDKTGFNVTSAIEINHEVQEDEPEANKERRTTPFKAETSAQGGRRTAAPKYTVVSPKNNK